MPPVGPAEPRPHPTGLPVAAPPADDERPLRCDAPAARTWRARRWSDGSAAIACAAADHAARVRTVAARSRRELSFAFAIDDPLHAGSTGPPGLSESGTKSLTPHSARPVHVNAHVPVAGGWLRVSLAAPQQWRFFTLAEAAAHCGIAAARVDIADGRYFVQLFRPSSQEGTGRSAEPPTDTETALARHDAEADVGGRRRANPWPVPAAPEPGRRHRCCADLLQQPAP